jgi:hypothetical protein
MALSDEQIDALLEADEKQSAHPMEMFVRIHERKRKRQHAKAKAAQPKLGVSAAQPPNVMAGLRKYACQPITADEREQTGMDYLCQTVIDTLRGDSVEDVLHALVRVWRKQYAWQPHLDPIEHGVHDTCPCIGCKLSKTQKG